MEVPVEIFAILPFELGIQVTVHIRILARKFHIAGLDGLKVLFCNGLSVTDPSSEHKGGISLLEPFQVGIARFSAPLNPLSFLPKSSKSSGRAGHDEHNQLGPQLWPL